MVRYHASASFRFSKRLVRVAEWGANWGRGLTAKRLQRVGGEVGIGPHGLCNTLPPAMEGRRGVIVYGHGLFTVGRDDFNEAFTNLLAVERMGHRAVSSRTYGTKSVFKGESLKSPFIRVDLETFY